MIKVGLISHTPNIGGAERMLYNMAVFLKNTANFLPIIFIPSSPDSDLKEMCEKANIEVVFFPNHAKYIFLMNHTMQNFAVDTLQMKEKLKDIMLESGIDLLLCNTATSLGPVLTAFELQIPVITWIHGILDSYLLTEEYNSKFRLFFDRNLIALSDKVLCCSKWTANFYQKYCLQDNMDVLYNWTEEPSKIMPIALENNRFVCLSAIQKPKGIFVLLEAAKILSQTNSQFQLCLYGFATEQVKKEIEGFIETNHLSQIVKIMGTTQKVQEVYNHCLCLVQPSFMESFGMTIIEAMSYQRPVIATKSGGPEEIIEDGITGFLVDRNDPNALAEKMAFVLEHKKEVIEMGKEGRKRYEKNFSPVQAKKQILSYLNEVIEGKKYLGKEQYLIYDSLIELLNQTALQTNSIVNTQQLIENTPILRSRIIYSERLVLSKMIPHSISYYILCDKMNFSQLGVIFTSFNKEKVSGEVTLQIYYKDHLLRTSKMNLSQIQNNCWSYFMFESLKECAGKILKVVLQFHYAQDTREYFGVYEDKEQRTFLYKVCNKLNMNCKQLNVLYVDCR